MQWIYCSVNRQGTSIVKRSIIGRINPGRLVKQLIPIIIILDYTYSNLKVIETSLIKHLNTCTSIFVPVCDTIYNTYFKVRL